MYFLTQDNDAHWYVVPVEREREWNEWCDIPPDDERSWDAPEWAHRVGGAPCLVHFKEWEIS